MALEKAVGEGGVKEVLEGKRGVIASCGSGMTAGVLWLGLRMLGVQSPAIYDEVSGLSSSLHLFVKISRMLMKTLLVMDWLRNARVE